MVILKEIGGDTEERADKMMVEDAMRSMSITEIEDILGEDMMAEIGRMYCPRCIEHDSYYHTRRKEI